MGGGSDKKTDASTNTTTTTTTSIGDIGLTGANVENVLTQINDQQIASKLIDAESNQNLVDTVLTSGLQLSGVRSASSNLMPLNTGQPTTETASELKKFLAVGGGLLLAAFVGSRI